MVVGLKNRKGFEMSFAWMFAILVGAAILFIAIYATTQFIDIAKHEQYSEAAKSITILLDPLETGIASSVGSKIGFSKETRLYLNCYAPNSLDVFGMQTIAFSEKSGIGKEWANPGADISIKNKFIFSQSLEQGEELFVFSQPFEMGFKVNDLIFASMEEHCFVAPPTIVENDLYGLTLENINVTNTINECLAGKEEDEVNIVCFDSFDERCDVYVHGTNGEFDVGYVEKPNKNSGDFETMYYTGSLIYGAIFSSAATYECNVKRLGKKTSEMAEVYRNKLEFIRFKNCDSAIGPYLDTMESLGEGIATSYDMTALYQVSKEMDAINKQASCRVY